MVAIEINHCSCFKTISLLEAKYSLPVQTCMLHSVPGNRSFLAVVSILVHTESRSMTIGLTNDEILEPSPEKEHL